MSFDDTNKIDPLGAPIILTALVTAERAADGSYSGTVDLTRATDADTVDTAIVDALGEKAKEIAFTTSLDGQGRLTRLTLQIPATSQVKAHELELSYSDYGKATPTKRPPANQTQEAPAAFYDSVNG